MPGWDEKLELLSTGVYHFSLIATSCDAFPIDLTFVRAAESEKAAAAVLPPETACVVRIYGKRVRWQEWRGNGTIRQALIVFAVAVLVRGQLKFDQLSQRRRVAADQGAAVDEHGGRAVHVEAQAVLLVRFHFLGGVRGRHAGLKRICI